MRESSIHPLVDQAGAHPRLLVEEVERHGREARLTAVTRASPRLGNAWRSRDWSDERCLAAVINDLALGPARRRASWGGTLAQELYRYHAGLVANLILIDTYAGWKGSLPEVEVRARVAGMRQMLASPATEFDPTLPGMFAGGPPAQFVPLLEKMAAGVRRESLKRGLSLMAETDQREMLSRIAVPTLLIWGELDVRSPLSVARQFPQAIPDAKLVVISGAGTCRISSGPSSSTRPCAISAARTSRDPP